MTLPDRPRRTNRSRPRATAGTLGEILPPMPPAPLGHPPPLIRAWFDSAATAAIPIHDGTLQTARAAADAYAHRAKAGNTRRAYRAGTRAWCDWCDQHILPCLPGRPQDVAAFLAAERGRGMSVNTLDLRRAAIRYLHYVAGCAVPTAEARVGETMAGIRHDAAEILREILAPIPEDLAGLRDRALLLIGFAGALRRAELARIQVVILPRIGGHL